MHELGICEAVLERVEQRAGDRRVDGVGLRAGTGLRLVPEALQQSFELLTMGTVLDGAALELEIVPGRGTCRDCGESFAVAETFPDCPACGSVVVSVEGGDELVVTWLRYADTEQADKSYGPLMTTEGR
jgi:hydrogenase nickel incorporation protein HypA/HybF